MITLVMFDDVNVFLLPAGAYAYAGYLDGHYANFGQVKKAHASARLVGIVTRARDDGDALDVEPGDAAISEVPGWVARQHARGVARPVVYVSAASAQPVIGTLAAAGIGRAAYRLWLAHYGFGAHICGPGSCGYPQADATQFTSKALGRSLDESLLADDFFGEQPLTFPVKQGDAGTEVAILQKMLNAWSGVIGLAPALVTDGDFGPKTLAAVRRAQSFFTVAQDGRCDQSLWAGLTGKPAPRPTPGTPRTAPAPVSVTNKGSAVTFSWPEVGGAARYQVDVTGTGGEAVGDWTVAATTAVIGIHGHPAFRWTTRAGNAHGWGPWGATHVYSMK
jgi:peptidoglycan hydrolase-like protein with peptidoglycan-binding domain